MFICIFVCTNILFLIQLKHDLLSKSQTSKSSALKIISWNEHLLDFDLLQKIFEKKQNPSLTNFDNCRIELHSLPHGCEQPAAPLNGHVTWVEGEATATFTCERGFTLTSNSSLQCICGRWNGSVPTCKRNLFRFNLIFNSILPRRSSQIASNSHQSNNRRRHAQLHQIFTSFIF